MSLPVRIKYIFHLVKDEKKGGKNLQLSPVGSEQENLPPDADAWHSDFLYFLILLAYQSKETRLIFFLLLHAGKEKIQGLISDNELKSLDSQDLGF